MFSLLSSEQRLNWIRFTTCISFLIGIIMSHRLWLSSRFFPTIPLDRTFSVSYPADIILLGLIILGLILTNFIKQRWLYILLFLSFVIVLIQDQLRWQPWVYLYLLILLPYGIIHQNKSNTDVLSYYQLVIIGLYFWSGLHKLNPNFNDFTFSKILTVIFPTAEPDFISKLSIWGYSIGIIEILTAVMLFWPRFRNIGILTAIITHVCILLYLSPAGVNQNSIVYPWNLSMILLVVLNFYKIKNLPFSWGPDKRVRILNFAAIILIWLLPALNFVGRWDHYLSFSLYSDKIPIFYIAVKDEEIAELDSRLHQYFVHIEGMSGGEIIDVNRWAMNELNVPFYPETRVFKKLSQSFCHSEIKNENIVFLEFERPLSKNKFVSFTCKD